MEAQRRRADPVDDPVDDLPEDVQGLIIQKLFSGDDPLAAGKAVVRWCARRKKSWGDEGMWRHAVEVGFGLSVRSVDGQLAAPPDFAGYWRSTFVYLCKGLRPLPPAWLRAFAHTTSWDDRARARWFLRYKAEGTRLTALMRLMSERGASPDDNDVDALRKADDALVSEVDRRGARAAEVRRLLEEQCANPNAEPIGHRHPMLLCAIRHNQIDVVEALIDGGARLWRDSPRIGERVHFVRFSRSAAMTELLFSRGALADSKAFIGVCGVANLAIIRLWISRGVDININRHGVHPLSAVSRPYRPPGLDQDTTAERINEILSHPNFNPASLNAGVPTALEMVAGAGDLAAASRLLQEPGIDVNAIGNSTPLGAAVMRRHLDMVNLLLAAPGIDVNALTRKYPGAMTPLMRAAERGGVEIVAALLAAPGIQVNARDHGRTALQYAYDNNNQAAATLLLERDAEL